MTLSATRAAPWVFALLLCACTRPPARYALSVRDPDKLCRIIVFSRCTLQPSAHGDSDGGADE